MTHVTCRLTAKNQDQLQNPTLGNRVCYLFTSADNVALPAFAAGRRARPARHAAPLLVGPRRLPLSINIFRLHGAQQQIRRTPPLRSSDGTDGRTGRETDRFIDPAPFTMRAVPVMPPACMVNVSRIDLYSAVL